MSMVTGPVETKRIMGGAGVAISRAYPTKCPYAVGDQIVLAVDGRTIGRGAVQVPYCLVQVQSVRSDRFGYRSEGEAAEKMARSEGFTSAAAWASHFRRGHRFVQPDTLVYRIGFRVLKKVDAEKEDMGDVGEGSPVKQQSARVQVGVPKTPARAPAVAQVREAVVVGRGDGGKAHAPNVFTRKVTLPPDDFDSGGDSWD